MLVAVKVNGWSLPSRRRHRVTVSSARRYAFAAPCPLDLDLASSALETRWRGGSGPAVIGRADELNAVRAVVDAAVGGTASAVLVSGEAGVGKTVLVRQAGQVRVPATAGVHVVQLHRRGEDARRSGRCGYVGSLSYSTDGLHVGFT